MKKTNVFTAENQALVSKIQFDGDLKQNVAQAVDAIGGFQKLVKAGDTILLKPNFNTADAPPGSSDPQFIRAVIELLYQHGAERVILGESSMFKLPTLDVLRQTGMLRAATEAGAEIMAFDDGEWVTVETGGRYLKTVGLAQAALESTKIVYACCLKTHRLADFTMSLKLAMGFVQSRDRVKMHLLRLREKLAELNLAIAPDLIVMDGRRCFISGGPDKGEAREPNLILASGDMIAIDVEGAKIIQSYPGHSLKKEPWELPLIRRAVELGLGAASEAAYRVVGGAEDNG